jgi:oxygen-dependent protoporphyrinogen oxidase
MKIAVIGGGISGVSAAFWLSKSLKELKKDYEITLFEKNEKLGGSIDTVTKGDFTVEAGPNGFLDSKPYTLKLVDDAGLSDKLYKSNDLARKRYIMRYGRLIRLPEKPPQFFKTDLLTLKGKLRVIAEYFVPQKILEDETIADFARRRLGSEACDYLISPMVSGIFAGDPEKMSLRACFPVIYELEVKYGGLFKGMLKKRGKKSGPAGPGGVLTSYSGGLINLINDVAKKFENVTIKTNAAVKSIFKENEKFRICYGDDSISFDVVILTCPAYEAEKIIRPLSEKLAVNFGKIPYAPAFVVGLGFDEKDIKDSLDGFGYLIPAKENRKILGALFTSSIFPERVKNDKRLIRVIMGGDRNRWILEKSNEELIDIAYNEIKDTLKITGKPVSNISFRWEYAIPQYYIGHLKIAESVEQISSEIGNFYVGGNILYGVGINDCTKRSFDIVEKIIQNIK